VQLPPPPELTVNVPQLAVLPLQVPELADTDTLYVPAVGLLQVGAFVQLIPLLTVEPLHCTVGGVIAVPAVPVEGKPVQVSVLEEEDGADELLAGTVTVTF